MTKTVRVAALGLLAVVAGMTGSGCGPGSAEPEAAAPPPVDERWATAESLVATFNDLATAPVQHGAIMSLYDTTDETARRRVETLANLEVLQPFNEAAEANLGAPFDETTARMFPREPIQQPATLTQTGDTTAMATYVDADGEEQPLPLVKVGREWRLDPAPLASHPELPDDPVKLKRLHYHSIILAGLIPQLQAKMNAGEYGSIAAARNDVKQRGWDYSTQNSRLFVDFRDVQADIPFLEGIWP